MPRARIPATTTRPKTCRCLRIEIGWPWTRFCPYTADAKILGGFSSDLLILQANSEHRAHDERQGSFYETLKRGEPYRGYYARPLEEIAAIFARMQENKKPTN